MTATIDFNNLALTDPDPDEKDAEKTTEETEVNEEQQNDLNEIRVGDDVGEPDAEDTDFDPTTEPQPTKEAGTGKNKE